MFSHHVETSIDIQATPEAAWNMLTDFQTYDDWNPMLQNVRTQPRVGSPVRFELLMGDGKRMKFKAKMTRVDAPVELNWTGGSPLIITGKHYFRIEKLGENQIRLHHGEYFKGLLFPLMAKTIQNSKPLYESMNQALKNQLEQ